MGVSKGQHFRCVGLLVVRRVLAAYFFLVRYGLAGIPKDDAGKAVGLYLLGWAIFTAYMTVASLRVSGAIALVFVLLTATYVLLTIAELGQYANVGKVGGYVGIATAAAAWYASFAGVTNSTFRRTVLPTLPLA